MCLWSLQAHFHVVGTLWFYITSLDINQLSFSTPCILFLVSISVSMALPSILYGLLHKVAPQLSPAVECWGCENKGPICWETRKVLLLGVGQNTATYLICFTYCQRFFSITQFLPSQSIHLHFFPNPLQSFYVLAVAYVMQVPVLTHRIRQATLLIVTDSWCRFLYWVPTEY